MLNSHRYVHNLIKYEFDWQFEIPATYPATAPEIELPELDGKVSEDRCCIWIRNLGGEHVSPFISTAMGTAAMSPFYHVTPCDISLLYQTSKMYRGGKICLTIHFKPLWAKNA